MDVVRFCLSLMNEYELHKMLRVAAYDILFNFSIWPFQSLFLHMADQMWTYLSKRDFHSLYAVIHSYAVNESCSNFDYAKLLKEFWNQCPTQLKEGIPKPL
ncbi:hypothetical protein CEXT_357391 [Caerostris extrusa]|uniref:Uncharacterized protein n=1 Tax=Caerostris extrusa TaxID=172846 RepID=A0AAV4XL35_CAEEX|nr:hypothetical protein CEXT_357391 [Caerostris extrusa]